MALLFLRAFWNLVIFDLCLMRGDFPRLYRRVRGCSVQARTQTCHSIEHISTAVDLAAIWYWKEVKCLQRSAALTCLLRRHGVAARMLIGAQQLPFKAHAWVEVNSSVVGDRPYAPEMYTVVERC